jgi:hypothetical protein
MLMRRASLALTFAVSLLFVASPTLRAQAEVPSLHWRTITTAHFRIHFEPGLEAWSEQLAAQIEGVRRVVAARVGYTPPRIIDVLVEDPLNQPNGSAWPSLTYPAMRFWATPPAPTSLIGNSRGWADILAIHEYAHLAHLLRPSRKRFSLPMGIFSVVPIGPITSAPAWVAEGYATLIEGELTGSGRPNGAMRPAILRTLALEGYLPAYGALDATNRFNGGAMRYLIGSAYLEWLQSMRGDSSLPQLWRRATSRSGRNFSQAFAATFGDTPDLLYGRFSADVTQQAFNVRDEITAQGLAQGTLVQKWAWGVGSPDISPNGERLAVRRSFIGDPGAVMIFSLKPDTAAPRRDSVATAKLLKKDPEDLPAYRAYPSPLRRVAALGPVGGTPYDAPRFFADGERVLVTRFVPLADGRARSDLFVWHTPSGKVRRVTRGAGILAADPTPDGKSAAALTCGGGTCSLVMVNLESGATRSLAAGGLDRGYAGVRVSPDGRSVASAQQQGSRWVPVVIDIASGAARVVGPSDAASRFSPAWENDSTLIVASDASGLVVLERLPLNGGSISVAVRTIGAANSPEVGPDGRLWWLDLHGRGWDLRVNDANSALPVAAAIGESNFPASRRFATANVATIPNATVPDASSYGRGPFGAAFIALGTQAADGGTWSAGATFGDPLGRGEALVIAGMGQSGAWSGLRGDFTWRRYRPALRVQGFSTEYRPSEHPRNAGAGFELFDEAYSGGVLSLDLTRNGVHGSTRYRAGASTGSITNPTLDTESVTRSVAFAEMSASHRFTPRSTRSALLSYGASYSSGSTNEQSWTRVTGDFAMGIVTPQGGATLRLRAGEMNADAPTAEYFAVGGASSPYVDPLVFAQRVEHLGLPFGTLGGRRYGVLTAETNGAFRLYHDWIVAGDEDFGETLRVLGAEFAMPIARVAVMRIPAVRIRAGASHSLNGVHRNATIGYLALTLQP